MTKPDFDLPTFGPLPIKKDLYFEEVERRKGIIRDLKNAVEIKGRTYNLNPIRICSLVVPMEEN